MRISGGKNILANKSQCKGPEAAACPDVGATARRSRKGDEGPRHAAPWSHWQTWEFSLRQVGMS